MDALFGTIRARRDDLIERGSHIAETTRDRGVGALGRVRNGALDWKRTVAARAAGLPEDAPWFRLAGLERRVLSRFDRVLALFAARVRAQMKRLRAVELPAKLEAEAPTKTKRAKGDGPAPKRLVLPIADYEQLTAREVLAELPRLTDAQCRAV